MKLKFSKMIRSNVFAGIKLIVTSIILSQAWASKAQNIEFITKLDQDSVAIGQPFKIEFQLKNTEGTFHGPDLSDFNVLGGPNYMSSYQMINGQSSIEQVYSYILEGREEGTFTLSPAMVDTPDGKLESQPMTITVYYDPEFKTPGQDRNPAQRETITRRKKSIKI